VLLAHHAGPRIVIRMRARARTRVIPSMPSRRNNRAIVDVRNPFRSIRDESFFFSEHVLSRIILHIRRVEKDFFRFLIILH